MYTVGVSKMALRLKWTKAVIIVLVIVNTTDGMKRIFGKTKSSNETCVFQPWDIYSFRRGQFQRLQKPAESLESLDRFDASVIIGKEVQCNDTYYMWSYLHLTYPQYFTYPEQVESLHKKINDEYPEWARKFLATAFNVGQSDNEMDVPWLFLLYVKRIEVHVSAAKDPYDIFLPVLQAAHYGMHKVLFCMMFENDCTMFDPKTKEERKFSELVADMLRSKPTNNDFSKNSDAVLKLLKKHWPDLCDNSSMGCHQNEASTSCSVPSVQPVTENHLTLDLLYLNDVFENAKGTTLLTEFGVFRNGDRLLRYLKDRVSQIKRGSTLFGQYVLSLVDFHEHVQRALKTMMLRIYYDFLEKLKMLNKDRREEHFEQLLKPFNDWCDFLYLPKDDNSFYMTDLQRSWTSDDSISELIISSIQKQVIDTLRENDKMSKIPLGNHESLDKINIDKSWIMVTAKEYDISLDSRFRALKDLPNNHIQTTILCAEVLVEFLKKIFNHISFKAIQSLVMLRTSTNFKRLQEYEQSNVFTT